MTEDTGQTLVCLGAPGDNESLSFDKDAIDFREVYMSDLDSALKENRSAMEDLVAASEASGEKWTTSPAPGKWTPSQVVEHVAITLEESAKVVAGQESKFPSFPGLLRPVLRGIVFRRTLKKHSFPKAKTFKPFDPEHGPATPGDARQRLQGALEEFDRACRDCASQGREVKTTTFGTVPVAEYAAFTALHTRHHRDQIH